MVGSPGWLDSPLPPVTPLTLSSPPKATPLWIILWRCSNIAGHGIARNQERALADINGSLDGGDQDLIASFKPHASVDLSSIPIVLPGNTAHRPPLYSAGVFLASL